MVLFRFIQHPRCFCAAILCGLLLLCFPSGIKADTGNDSLAKVLESIVDSSAKLATLQEIYTPLIYDDPQSCIRYARQALDIAVGLGDYEAEVDALQTIAWVYQGLNYLDLALDRSLKAEGICKTRGLEEPLGNIYNTLGSIEYGSGNPNEAINYFRRSLVIRRKFGPQSKVAASLNNIGMLSMEIEELDTARHYLNEALELYKEIDFERGEITVMGNLGDLDRMEKDFDAARSYFGNAILQAKEASLSDLEHTLQHALAITERDAGNRREARRLLEEIVDSTEGEDPLSAMVFGELAAMAEERGDLNKALTYLKLQAEIKDSLKAWEREDQLASVQTVNKISLEEKEIEFQEQQDALTKDAKLKRAQLVSGLYLVGALALLIVAITLFMRFREHRRLNRRLSVEVEERTDELLRANSELNTFIYQSSHDLRGPINTIMGLQQLLEGGTVETEQVANMLDRKVRQLEKGQRSLVHSMELRNRALSKTPVDIRELVADVIKNVRQGNRADKVDFQFDIQKGTYSTDPWVISVLLEHLIDNAIVFSSEKRKARIRIGARILEDGLEMEISDNGIGMTEEVRQNATKMFYRGSNISTGNGLGLYNVQLAVDLLRGHLRFEGTPGKGTTIRLKFS